MSTVYSDQDIVKNILVKSIEIMAQNTRACILPSYVLEIFFRRCPIEQGLHFIESNQGYIYSAEEVVEIERKVTDKLLVVYSGYTQAPSTRDVLTDTFGELKKLNVSVCIR